jgi:hypothetical protein
VAYRLKYVHAASANKTIVKIHREKSLIPVFLGMGTILSLKRESQKPIVALLFDSTCPAAHGGAAQLVQNSDLRRCRWSRVIRAPKRAHKYKHCEPDN